MELSFFFTHRVIEKWRNYEKNNCVGFGILIVMAVKSSILWDITPCIMAIENRRFETTYSNHLQGQRVSQARNQHKADSKQSPACCLLHALFLV
jgi:hypothetical protein